MYKPDKRDKKGMKYSFRFLRLKEIDAKKLADDLVQYKPKVKERFDKLGYTLVLRLNKRIKAKVLFQVMRKHKIKQNKTDVFASLLAQKDTDIIGVPKYVNEVLRVTHSNLTFSFTYVG
jgi:hypothetical protein